MTEAVVAKQVQQFSNTEIEEAVRVIVAESLGRKLDEVRLDSVLMAELGAESVVANAHFVEEGHDYGPSKQAAAIAFLARHLHLDTTRATAADGRPVLAGIEIEPPETMHNFTSDSPRPADAPSGVDAVTALLAPVQKKD
jgi:hypothetical protein